MQKAFLVALAGVLAAGCAAEPEQQLAPDLAGTSWLAEDIDNRGVMDYARTTLSFPEPGQAVGSGGCNRYFGDVTISGRDIRFGSLGATTRACAPALMEQEQRFLDALARVQSFRLDASRGLLYLADRDGDEILRFSALDE